MISSDEWGNDTQMAEGTMSLIEEAYTSLFPGQQFPYYARLVYSGKFKPYNANVKLRGTSLTFNLAKEWKDVGKEIHIGLLQDLFARLLKQRRQTLEMDLYHTFVKKLHLTMPKTKSDPMLSLSFQENNQKFFYSTL